MYLKSNPSANSGISGGTTVAENSLRPIEKVGPKSQDSATASNWRIEHRVAAARIILSIKKCFEFRAEVGYTRDRFASRRIRTGRGTKMRWIVFDDETAEVVVSQWRRGAAEISQEHPLDAALRAGESSVLVLPSRVPGQMLVARVHATRAVAEMPPPPAVVAVEEPTDRKAWWRKFVA